MKSLREELSEIKVTMKHEIKQELRPLISGRDSQGAQRGREPGSEGAVLGRGFGRRHGRRSTGPASACRFTFSAVFAPLGPGRQPARARGVRLIHAFSGSMHPGDVDAKALAQEGAGPPRRARDNRRPHPAARRRDSSEANLSDGDES